MAGTTVVEANGAAVPVLGLGTWKLRGEECARMVAESIALGYRHIDSAQGYDNEEAVGAGLRNSGLQREEVFVTTKIGRESLGPDTMCRAAEASLGRLGLDRLDLILIHWPNAEMSAAEMMDGLGAVAREGFTRHVGVSNFPPGLLERSIAASDVPLAANQCEYHPRLDQSKLIELCRRHGIAFVSYSPLGQGDVVSDPLIKEIAEAKGRTPGQIVLRWHVQQDGVAAIPKTASIDRARENLDIFDFSLSDDEMARISGMAEPDGRRVSPAWAPDWSD